MLKPCWKHHTRKRRRGIRTAHLPRAKRRRREAGAGVVTEAAVRMDETVDLGAVTKSVSPIFVIRSDVLRVVIRSDVPRVEIEIDVRSAAVAALRNTRKISVPTVAAVDHPLTHSGDAAAPGRGLVAEAAALAEVRSGIPLCLR